MMILSKANTTKSPTQRQIYTFTRMNWTQDRIYQHLYHHYPITRIRFQRPPIRMPRHRHLPLAWVNIIIILHCHYKQFYHHLLNYLHYHKLQKEDHYYLSSYVIYLFLLPSLNNYHYCKYCIYIIIIMHYNYYLVIKYIK